MNFASYRSHVTPLYHQSNLLKINDIYHLEIAKMMHCLHNDKLPQTLMITLSQLLQFTLT